MSFHVTLIWSASVNPGHQTPSCTLPLQAPEGLPNQLVKCVMKREYNSARPKAIKYTLRLGDRVGHSTFMMTALQVSRYVSMADLNLSARLFQLLTAWLVKLACHIELQG